MALTVLLVDDDPLARSAMERAIVDDVRLRPFAPRVIQAASGEQGLAMFVNDRPEVVVTDLIMTGMDGFGFCRAIREAPFGQDVRLIVISGIYKDASLAASLDKDVQATFLPKPFSRTELIEAILVRAGLPSRNTTSMAQVTTETQASAPVQPSAFPPPASASPPEPPATPFPGEGTETIRSFPPSHAGRVGPSGSLTDRGVAHLLFDLADGGQTGTLALSRGQVRKEIYIREGRVVAADSNLRQEALGTLLCAKGIIDERQLAYLLAETKARGHKMGAVLVELGWLSPEEVLQCLAAQVRKRIVDCLRWDEGAWTFTPGDTFGERIIEHDLDIERTIFMGLMRTAAPEKLVTRFDQNGDRAIRLARRFAKHRDSFDAVFGTQIIEVLSTSASVGSLALRDDAHLVIAAIDTLLETGLADLGEPVREPTTSEPSGTWQSSMSLERLGNEVSRRIVINPKGVGDEFFSQVSQRPTPSPESPADDSQPTERHDSGEMDMGMHTFALAPEKDASVESPRQAARQAIMRTYLSLRGKPLYEALGVARDASTSEILAAISTMAADFSPARMAGIELSAADQANLEALRAALDQAAHNLANPQLRLNYDRSLAQATAPEIDPLGAELAFGEGMQLYNNDRVAEAISKFQAAVQARPDQALYQAYLGWAQFVAHGPEHADTAREALKLALSLDPDLAEAHAMQGRLAATENDAATARDCLQRSLTLQPEQPETIDLLFEAYRRLNDPKGAEAFLRKLVAALGEQARPLQRRLWRELALIYETQLGDRLSARIAYDTAARLAPTDIDILRKSAEMNAEDPSRWREMASAITAEWQLNPQDASAGERLLNLFVQHNRADAAAITAAAMVLRGVATIDIMRLANESRKTEAPRWPSKLPSNWPHRLGYPPEFSAVEDLLALLAESGVLPPSSLRDLGLNESEALLAPGHQSSLFRSTLTSLCGLLGLDEPRVFLHPAFAGEAHMAHTRPPSLFCGRELLEQTDPVELGFRLSRALAMAPLGRLAGSTRSGGQLRPFFMAALATARGGLHSENPVFEAAKACLASLAAPVRARIAESSQGLVREYGSINLTAWTKSLGRTATRLSLLVCSDLQRVGGALAEEEGQASLDDLISFALSFDYLDFNEETYASASVPTRAAPRP
jgi:CheY-like chemotaxis protein